MVKKGHLNSLLDIMIMKTLSYYVKSFLKWLGMLNTLKVTIRPCFLKSLIKSCLKSTWEKWEKNSSLINM